MIYTAFSLNGQWEMEYTEDKYISNENPFDKLYGDGDIAGTEPDDMSAAIFENAVPGYWEDMTAEFQRAPFFSRLRINPEYGIQKYPIAGTPPDMALPNIVGTFFYKKSFVAKDISAPTAIHFEGVQNSVSVWINDSFIGSHEGYSAPFEIDVPDGIIKDGENTIILSVSNHRLLGYGGEPVSGLTSRAANECTGGITGDVELRVYNTPLRDATVLISEDLSHADVKIESTENISFEWQICDGNCIVKSGSADGDFSFDTTGLEFWAPESPKLYTLIIKCGENTLEKNIGIRRLVAAGSALLFNGKPYFLRGACEHGYFPETIHPNHDKNFYINVIKKLKKLGFNFIRFHTFVPEKEYLEAANELGMLMHIECPNNTTTDEWKEIVRYCRQYPCAVIYCCGNELLMDEPFIEYLNECADYVHENTDALFAPMNAMRGLEYFWCEPEQEKEIVTEPIKHHPRRIETVGKFSDVFCSYPEGVHSYFSLDGEPSEYDKADAVYKKPRISHEICIDGTYTDLSLKDRYKGLKVGETEMFSSLEKHLEEKGVLHKAPIYFKNSSEWQRRIRKFCFEKLRRSEKVSGYDFLGPIDTHWHTFGYDVGMMNEFYELKPGETNRNVLMYNSETVILTDLSKKTNFTEGETLKCSFIVSHYGAENITDAILSIRLTADSKTIKREKADVKMIECGTVKSVYDFAVTLPKTDKPSEMKLYVTLDGENVFAENEWELYIFPKANDVKSENAVVSYGLSQEELIELLKNGKDVLLFGAEPFVSLPTTFRIALAGRTGGNLATVVKDHDALENFPHDGFCGWQFARMMENAKAVCFECDDVAFNPIVEVVSTHKYVIRQAAMFEFNALNGRIFVCSLNMDKDDASAQWLKSQIINYVNSDRFDPVDSIDEKALRALMNVQLRKAAANTNVAFNPNDKTASRKKK